ncbi:MAG: S8 family peptidase [Bacteroidia bacterium]|nr:S8 family peptidase [Bacteroidia bacterium]
MKKIYFLFCLLFSFQMSFAGSTDFVAQTVIVKVKPFYRKQCKPNSVEVMRVKKVLSELQVNHTQLLFPQLKNVGKVDLSLVYELHYQSELDAQKAAELLMQTGIFEYAEPRYTSIPLYTPNDANIANQTHHTIIHSYEGWDLEQGDTNIVIGITDTSFDILHPDLSGNIKYNYADPAGNGDNDGDGYTDNYSGWDLANNDNTMYVSGNYHGTGVATFAGATTNNGIGVAGTGFKSKVMLIKVAPDANQNSITHGYEGIVYAVNHGCKVVNCSWGNTTYSQFAQDVINYATFDFDATIIASSGDSAGGVTKYYPASYAHVISVGGTDNNDCNFYQNNHAVDIVAPSLSLYGTASVAPGNPVYTSSGGNGTSFSAPLVSGAVALVRAHFPAMNALQAAEQVIVHADNIYGLSCNSALTDRLGVGRLNIYQALLGMNEPSVRMTDFLLDASNNQVAIAGQSTSMVCGFTNYLANATNVVVTLSTTASYISITQGVAALGDLNTLQATTNAATPFLFTVAANTPLNQKVEFKLSFVGDNGYTAYQYFEVDVNRDYMNIEVNNLATTVCTRGKIGYNTPYQQSGLGIAYKPLNDSSQVFLSTFMIGSAAGNVSDMGYSATPPAPEFDFQPVSRIVRTTTNASDFDTEATFNDNGAGGNALGVQVKQINHAWVSDPNKDFVIWEYHIKNNSANTLNDVYAGIFADWEVMGTNNKADFDINRQLAYAYNPSTPDVYMGIKLLEPSAGNCYNIDAIAGGSGGVDISDGFTGAEKYTSLSTSRNQAGGTSGNDIAQVMSAGPFDLAPGDSVKVSFAILGSLDLNSLQVSADQAQTAYNGIGVSAPVSKYSNSLKLFPNPAHQYVNVYGDLSGKDIQILDALGRTQHLDKTTIGPQLVKLSIAGLTPGVYVVKVGNEVRRLIVE